MSELYKSNKGKICNGVDKKADLHIHTSLSDGSFTPDEVVRYAKKMGLSCIAICDHDCVDALKISDKLQQSYDIEIIPGVEITAQEDGKELHMLGYFIDWQSKKLKEVLLAIRQNRIERLYEMVDRLKEHGINADAKEIINFAGDVSLSRLHIARYLVEKGFVASMRTAFDKYIGDERPCYVSHFRFSSKETIDIINDVSGIAVIAHPGLNNVIEVLPTLVKNGIEGIEVYHSDQTKSVSRNLEKFAQNNNLLITGGSDCHGINKREILMGKVKLPYKYVEKMKEYNGKP